MIIEQLKYNQLYDLAEFIVNENYKCHLKGIFPLESLAEIESIYKEEQVYFSNSNVFVLKDTSNVINGSIRVFRWDYMEKLPLQKLFGLNINISDYDIPIWHIGRFAIKKGLADVNILKLLMVYAIAPICKDHRSIAYAECDQKLLKTLSFLGIEVEVLDEPIDYLGSETIPICLHYFGVIKFYNQYKYMMINPLCIMSK